VSGSITINSNLASLNAQRRLGQSTTALQQSFTRLSSGLRINKAGDDAAGLAISESLQVDSRVFSQGIRNLNDGLSTLAVADGAVAQLTNIVIRLQELAEQSSNGTLGHEQRQAIDEEAQTLSAEYFRIAQSTEFNGQRLFDGSYGDLRLQAGFGTDGGIVSGLGGAIGDGTFGAYSSYSLPESTVLHAIADFNADGNIDSINVSNVNGIFFFFAGLGDGTFSQATSFSVGQTVTNVESADLNNDGVLDLIYSRTGSIYTLLGNGNGSFKAGISIASSNIDNLDTADFNSDGIIDIVSQGASASVFLGHGDGTFEAEDLNTLGDDASDVTTGDFNNDGIIDFAVTDEDGDSVGVLLGLGNGTFSAMTSFTIGNEPEDVLTADLDNDGNLDFVVQNSKGGKTNISVIFGVGDGTFENATDYDSISGLGKIALGDFNGDGAIDIARSNFVSGITILLGNGDGTFGAVKSFEGKVTTGDVTPADFNGDGVLDLAISNPMGISLGNAVDGVAPLLPFSLETMADARQALPMFQQKLEQLAGQRAQIGAFESRLNTAISTTKVMAENYSSAASQITDADVAIESAKLIKNQILQQAGTAVLAQANQAPTLALALLTES
jgi:flagellin